MPFPETVKDAAYLRSGGRCECTRQHGGRSALHSGGRCPSQFGRIRGWEAHHIVDEAMGGDNTLSNCQSLCIACHDLTQLLGDS